jgi:hypothetical protein
MPARMITHTAPIAMPAMAPPDSLCDDAGGELVMEEGLVEEEVIVIVVLELVPV